MQEPIRVPAGRAATWRNAADNRGSRAHVVRFGTFAQERHGELSPPQQTLPGRSLDRPPVVAQQVDRCSDLRLRGTRWFGVLVLILHRNPWCDFMVDTREWESL
jgi:hypothetical protein